MYAPKPKVMQTCNLFDCPKWIAMEWSQARFENMPLFNSVSDFNDYLLCGQYYTGKHGGQLKDDMRGNVGGIRAGKIENNGTSERNRH